MSDDQHPDDDLDLDDGFGETTEEMIARWDRQDREREQREQEQRGNGDASGQADQVTPLPFIDMSNWDNEPLPERDWAVLNRFPLRQAALLSGEGGTGKSKTGLHLCCAHSLGRDWLGSLPELGPAIFLDAEDDLRELHIRTGMIAKHYGVTFDDLIKGGLHLLSFAGKDAVLATVSRSNRADATLQANP
jgi:RecA-family ATPase